MKRISIFFGFLPLVAGCTPSPGSFTGEYLAVKTELVDMLLKVVDAKSAEELVKFAVDKTGPRMTDVAKRWQTFCMDANQLRVSKEILDMKEEGRLPEYYQRLRKLLQDRNMTLMAKTYMDYLRKEHINAKRAQDQLGRVNTVVLEDLRRNPRNLPPQEQLEEIKEWEEKAKSFRFDLLPFSLGQMPVNDAFEALEPGFPFRMAEIK